MALWVRIDAFEDGSSLCGWHALGPPKRSVDLRLRKVDGQAIPEFYFENTAHPERGGELAAVSNRPIELGQWSHIAGVREAGERLVLYVDGQKAAETRDFAWNMAADVPFALSDQIPFTGDLDEVMLWDRTLSEETVYRVYQAGLVALTKGPPQ
jgi:hypothetical protein